jgi:hypothetical protein
LLKNDIYSERWIYIRNTVIQFLTDFDEMNQEGKKLVSKDFQTNVIGPEVVIPFTGNSHMIDYKFIDAKVDKQSRTMTVRVKIWWYFGAFQVKTWDFTLDLTHFSDEYNTHPLITKVWQVDETNIDSHTVFPGLSFKF